MNYKTILACATLLTSMVFFNGHLNAAVESGVVGYTTVELTQKFNLVGINFSALDGSDTVNVKDLFSGTFTNGDQIQVPKTTGPGYDICVWLESANMWIDYGSSEEEPAATTRTVDRGNGVWLVLNSATEDAPVAVTMSGSVDLLSTKEIALGQGYVIAAPALPMELSINSPKLIWSGLADGDQIQIPKTTGPGYDIGVWVANSNMWIDYGSSEETPVASTRVIQHGAAVWVVSANADTKVTLDPTK